MRGWNSVILAWSVVIVAAALAAGCAGGRQEGLDEGRVSEDARLDPSQRIIQRYLRLEPNSTITVVVMDYPAAVTDIDPEEDIAFLEALKKETVPSDDDGDPSDSLHLYATIVIQGRELSLSMWLDSRGFSVGEQARHRFYNKTAARILEEAVRPIPDALTRGFQRCLKAAAGELKKKPTGPSSGG